MKLSNSEILYADLIIAADGIRSKSWTVVTNEEPKTYSSGSAIFRCAYPTSHAMKSLLCARTGMYRLTARLCTSSLVPSAMTLCWSARRRYAGGGCTGMMRRPLRNRGPPTSHPRQLYSNWTEMGSGVPSTGQSSTQHLLKASFTGDLCGGIFAKTGIASGARGTDWGCRPCFLAYVGERWNAGIWRRCVTTLLFTHCYRSERLGCHSDSNQGTQHATAWPCKSHSAARLQAPTCVL